jgi:hypothetical protein
MDVTLPTVLASLLAQLGLRLPGSSETGLLALAGTWQQYSDRLPNGVRSAPTDSPWLASQTR